MPQSQASFLQKEEERNHNKELYSVCIALSILGLAFSSWASRVPDIRNAALLTSATLGYALLLRGSGPIFMMPLVAASINKFGARKVTLVSGLFVAVSLIPISLMNSWLSLGILLMIVGGGTSGYNIAVNALGSKVEADTGKSHMSKIHSWFGIGNLTGALIGSLMIKLKVSIFSHYLGISFLMLAILFFVYPNLPKDNPNPDSPRPKFQWPHGGLIAIGIICFLAASIESSINNWIGLFFTDFLKVEEGYGGVGYAVFAGALLGIRIIGDRLKSRFGAKKLLILGPSLAALGIILAIFSPNMIIAALGFFIAGAGVALNFPMLFSAAGKEGAIALTSVAAFGYVGGMVSQPIMGLIVERFELMGGFIFIACCALSVAILSAKARLLRA